MSSHLGVYQDFPKVTHFTRHLSVKIPISDFKRVLVKALSNLNQFNDKFETSSTGREGSITVDRTFEVGVAENLYFNYLDSKETKRLLKAVKKKVNTLDFMVMVHYRYMGSTGKKSALRLDQYLLRFGFLRPLVTICQVRGLQRTLPEDLLQMIIEGTKKALKREAKGEKINTTDAVGIIRV